eukprot:4343316-Alexandrium_andersonii.AAC.1
MNAACGARLSDAHACGPGPRPPLPPAREMLNQPIHSSSHNIIIIHSTRGRSAPSLQDIVKQPCDSAAT